ncbi:choice-of-anchor I family protein [Salinibius halmophilus]|uniref:choice-of-anchor I family protein n=1 Tax=Salinibius halmophilus TaxID=1853216 RepID=UPI000E66CAFB|nr:choice-of-anchor I family protein [Salinibius halmophilus]
MSTFAKLPLLAVSVAALSACQTMAPKTSDTFSANLVGRAVLGGEGAAEIVQYHAASQRVFAINNSGDATVVNAISIADLAGEAMAKNAEGVVTGTNLSSGQVIDMLADAQNVGGINSIAINGDLMAVAAEAEEHADDGQILFYDLSGEQVTFIASVPAGNLPDMVTFTPDGSKVIAANEGEPSDDYTYDPEGSLTVVEIDNGQPGKVTQLNFRAFNDQKAALSAQGMSFPSPAAGSKINGATINTTVAQDLEPEYITATNEQAFVALQENNGFAILDLDDYSLQVKGLGEKSWSGLNIDTQEEGKAEFYNWDNLYGLYQPDTIAQFEINGETFIATANEGDAREYFFDVANETFCELSGGMDYDEDDGCLAFIDEFKVKDLPLDASIAAYGDDDRIRDLRVTSAKGDVDGDGDYDKLYAYGARSFSIFNANAELVYDSGDEFSVRTKATHGDLFNNNDDENEGDSRSENKAHEPEALAIGKIGKQTIAFIGLERMGGIFAYDVSEPANAQYLGYMFNRGLENGADLSGDLAPEGMVFIDAKQSPTGEPLLVVGNEISGSVSIWQIQ